MGIPPDEVNYDSEKWKKNREKRTEGELEEETVERKEWKLGGERESSGHVLVIDRK